MKNKSEIILIIFFINLFYLLRFLFPTYFSIFFSYFFLIFLNPILLGSFSLFLLQLFTHFPILILPHFIFIFLFSYFSLTCEECKACRHHPSTPTPTPPIPAPVPTPSTISTPAISPTVPFIPSLSIVVVTPFFTLSTISILPTVTEDIKTWNNEGK